MLVAAFGLSQRLGLEIATRTLDAQLAVCDEIGPSEAPSVLAAANGGVPVIASAHAATLEELMRRPDVQSLHQAGVFGAYVGIHRKGGERDFAYKVCMREEMEEGRCP